MAAKKPGKRQPQPSPARREGAKSRGDADDIARAVVFLVSEYDDFITGTTLDINGGVYVELMTAMSPQYSTPLE